MKRQTSPRLSRCDSGTFLDAKAVAASNAISELGAGPYQLRVLLLAGGVYAAEGCILLLVSLLAKPLAARMDLDLLTVALMFALFFVGIVLGTTLGGLACDRFGRRVPILVTYGGLIVTVLAGISAPNISFLIAAEFGIALSLSFGVPASNACVAECCPSQHRSNIYCMTMVLFSCGQMYVAGVFWVLSPRLDPETLRWQEAGALCALLPGLLFCLAYAFLPESIFWLLAQKRLEEARAGLASAYRCNRSSSPCSQLREAEDETAEENPQEIAENADSNVEDGAEKNDEASIWALNALGSEPGAVSSSLPSVASCASYGSAADKAAAETKAQESEGKDESSSIFSLKDFWRVQALFSDKFRHTTITMLGVTFASNFAYYGMIYGLPDTLSSAAAAVEHKADSLSPAAGVFLAALCEIPGVLLTLVLGMTIGRRTNMSIAFAGCSVCLFGLVCAILTGRLMSMGMLCVFGVKIFLASGYIIVYLYLLELYPTTFRATGLAVCMVVGRIGAALCPILFELSTFFFTEAMFFAIVSFAMAGASWACNQLPYETKDAELQSESAPLQ
eukprot:TRINITY_DN11493_c0_g1_i1.p1 TRINITY_DN11493_c0_g1~~TRINITY_DN11493_c0_g1_i1.p1  ORF type:complete len:563 (+),score=84.31 TRINITY_DN11493_c0_g1_i1:247-1935(+)